MYVEEKREAEAPVVESPERQVILCAIEILSQPGVWICGNPDGVWGRHCLSTAIQSAAWPTSVSGRVHALVQAQLCLPIPDWNDTPGRTLDEVLGVLRKTAELL